MGVDLFDKRLRDWRLKNRLLETKGEREEAREARLVRLGGGDHVYDVSAGVPNKQKFQRWYLKHAAVYVDCAFDDSEEELELDFA